MEHVDALMVREALYAFAANMKGKWNQKNHGLFLVAEDIVNQQIDKMAPKVKKGKKNV